MFFGGVGEKAEMTDTHEALRNHVKREAADEVFGIEGHRFQPVFVSLRAKSGLDSVFPFPAEARHRTTTEPDGGRLRLIA